MERIEGKRQRQREIYYFENVLRNIWNFLVIPKFSENYKTIQFWYEFRCLFINTKWIKNYIRIDLITPIYLSARLVASRWVIRRNEQIIIVYKII